MNRPILALAALLGGAAACGESNQVVSPPESFRLIWSDEFEGPAGAIDGTKWVHDIGIGPNGDGWGNGQQEFNTNLTSNSSVADGNLYITARRQSLGGRDFTSARIKTQGLFDVQYGRIEAKIKLPIGLDAERLWPAFWMLGKDFEQPDDWPEAGEIDVMEAIGGIPNVVFGSLHGPGYSGNEAISNLLTSNEGFADEFYVFAVEWDPSIITWWVDDQAFATVTGLAVAERGDWVFDDRFFLLLNLAVGGEFVGGNVPPETVFPQQMIVDYVRVYERVR